MGKKTFTRKTVALTDENAYTKTKST